MPNYGTLGVLDTLAAVDNQTVLQYTESRLYEDFAISLAAHNRVVDDLAGDLVERTTDRVRRYGVASQIEMIEVDEFGRADSQKAAPTGTDVGIPLRLFQATLGWTRKYFETHTPAELTAQMVAAQRADAANVYRMIRRALYTPTNSLTFKDSLVDGITLPVRALLNADGAAIPNDEYGTEFDGATHTHYSATATLTAANITALINNVVEHGNVGRVELFINRAQLTAISGFTANFTPYTQPLIIAGTSNDRAAGTLSSFNQSDQEVGVWDGSVPVTVKPWVLPSYPVVADTGSAQKPIGWRSRVNAPTNMLRLVADNEQYPLRAQTWERETGMAVIERHKAAVLYTGGASYVAPTIS